MDDYICMGRVFRMLRREKEFSQFDVAYRSEINLSYYCRMERGEANPSLKKISAVLKTLGVPPVRFVEMVTLEMQCYLVQPQTEPELEAEEESLQPLMSEFED